MATNSIVSLIRVLHCRGRGPFSWFWYNHLPDHNTIQAPPPPTLLRKKQQCPLALSTCRHTMAPTSEENRSAASPPLTYKSAP